VIVDAVKDPLGKGEGDSLSVSKEAGRSLQKDLVEAFAKDLPSIGFQTICHHNGFEGMLSTANYVERRLPLLLIDSRSSNGECACNNLDVARRILFALESKCAETGRVNFYHALTWSFLHSVIRKMQRNADDMATPGDSYNDGKKISKVLKNNRANELGMENDQEGKDDVKQSKASDADPKGMVKKAIDIMMELERVREINDDNSRTELEVKFLLELRERVESAWDVKTLNKVLSKACLRNVQIGGRVSDGFKELLRYDTLFEKSECSKNKKKDQPWCLVVKLKHNEGDNEEFVVENGKAVLSECIVGWLNVGVRSQEEMNQGSKEEIHIPVRKYKKGYGQYKKETFPINKYIAAISLLESENLYSKNISDIEGIKATMKKVAKMDRLPDENSLEGMQIVQMAWDKVDIFNSSSSSFKTYAKLTYTLQLLLGLSVAVITVISLNEASFFRVDKTDSIVMGLTLAGSAVTAFINFASPSTKWRQFRGAALALESEIWKFRTRSGSYNALGNGVSQRGAEERLQEISELIKQHVLKSANMMNTAFMSKFDGLGRELNQSNPTIKSSERMKKVKGVISKVYADGTYDVKLERGELTAQGMGGIKTIGGTSQKLTNLESQSISIRKGGANNEITTFDKGVEVDVDADLWGDIKEKFDFMQR